ncbi:hypothetical protein GDO81_019514 [Engystomops pustulosus]|uniref:Uncharacterized protein n=1 Tax=Engystomops pustulosus TaxID=76066 RepID=A0AAV6Z9S3_ENGPU|nr:hypothetical protein GDO81_019514 [Engystomops pustulosus]
MHRQLPVHPHPVQEGQDLHHGPEPGGGVYDDPIHRRPDGQRTHPEDPHPGVTDRREQRIREAAEGAGAGQREASQGGLRSRQESASPGRNALLMGGQTP